MPSAYLDINDYALIGDCRSAALVGRDGSIDWLCLPDFDSPSLLGAILDRERGGRLQVSAASGTCISCRYLPRTNVLETRFRSDDGVLKVTDFMVVAEGSFVTGLEPERELTRIVEAESGTPEVELLYQPRPAYGAASVALQDRGAVGWVVTHGRHVFLLRSDIPLQPAGAGVLRGAARVRAGERRYVSLSSTHGDIAIIPSLGRESEQKLASTVEWWRGWSSQCAYDGPYQDAVLRSLLVLKLLTFSLSGAVIAAPTTSLPEAIGGNRNWDYRYCWLRDASFVLRAFLDFNMIREGLAFFDWLLHATRLTAPSLNTIYDLYGRTSLPERELAHLEGYRGSRPVRIGNGAANQLQLDIYGTVVMTAYDLLERGGELDADELRLLESFGSTVTKSWREPDNGIWEFRHARLHNTYSKLMCWTALDRLDRMQRTHVLRSTTNYANDRDAIRRSIDQRAWNSELGSYTGAFGETFSDATLLLMARCEFLPANHPRMRSTVAHIRRKLDRSGLLLRYERGVDRFPSSEGAFLTCTFWLAEYLAYAGDTEGARACIQTALGYASPLLLLAEEADPGTGVALGNYPQAFSHTGLLNATAALYQAELEAKAAEAT